MRGILGLEGRALSGDEKKLYDFIDKVVFAPNLITDEEFEEVRAFGFSDGALMELVETVAFSLGLCRLVDTLKLETDAWYADPSLLEPQAAERG